jgi:hypothetical protein
MVNSQLPRVLNLGLAKWRSLGAVAGGFPPPYYHSLFPAAAPDCCSTPRVLSSPRARLGSLSLERQDVTLCVCVKFHYSKRRERCWRRRCAKRHAPRASALSLAHSLGSPACSPANQPPPHCNPLGVQLNQFSPQWLSNFTSEAAEIILENRRATADVSDARDRRCGASLYENLPAGPILAKLFSHSIAVSFDLCAWVGCLESPLFMAPF